MSDNTRLSRIENSLAARERVLVWLSHERRKSGFIETVKSMVRSHIVPGALVREPEELFFYNLAMECNQQVYELLGIDPTAKLLVLIMSSYAGLLLEHGSPNPKQISYFKKILVEFLEDGAVLPRAIEAICKDYFADHRVLFADAEKRLNDRLEVSQVILDTYNILAPQIGVGHLDVSDMEAVIFAEADKKSQRMVSLARAQTYRSLGYDFAADLLPVPILDGSPLPRWTE